MIRMLKAWGLEITGAGLEDRYKGIVAKVKEDEAEEGFEFSNIDFDLPELPPNRLHTEGEAGFGLPFLGICCFITAIVTALIMIGYTT